VSWTDSPHLHHSPVKQDKSYKAFISGRKKLISRVGARIFEFEDGKIPSQFRLSNKICKDKSTDLNSNQWEFV